MEPARQSPEDEDGGENTEEESDLEGDASDGGEDGGAEDGDEELGDGLDAAKRQRKKRSEATEDNKIRQKRYGADDDEEEQEEDTTAEEAGNGTSNGGPDMSTEAMADRARRAAREDDDDDANLPDAIDTSNTSAQRPSEAAAQVSTHRSPLVAAKLAKLALHEDLLHEATTPRPPHYGTIFVQPSRETAAYITPSHAFGPTVYPSSSPRGNQSLSDRAADRGAAAKSSPRGDVATLSQAHLAGSLTYRHMAGRTARDRQLVLEASYAEMALSGRSRLPASYLTANKRLKDQGEYIDEVGDEY